MKVNTKTNWHESTVVYLISSGDKLRLNIEPKEEEFSLMEACLKILFAVISKALFCLNSSSIPFTVYSKFVSKLACIKRSAFTNLTNFKEVCNLGAPSSTNSK